MVNLYNQRYPEKYKAQKRKYYATEAGKASKKREDAAFVASGGRLRAERKRATRPVSEARLAARKRWRERNKWYFAYDRALRRRIGRMPMSTVDRLEVKALYQFCGAFPWFEVDHIVPIKGKTISGLHVLSNLQVLEKTLNKRKGSTVCPAYVELREQVPITYKRA